MIISFGPCSAINKALTIFIYKFSSLIFVIRVDSAKCFHPVSFMLKSILQDTVVFYSIFLTISWQRFNNLN